MTEELQNRIRSYISDRSGLYFKDHDLRNLNEAVALRMKACRINSLSAYHTYLTVSDQKEDEIRELFNLLTINHTYFFRSEPRFKIFKERLLRKYRAAESEIYGQKYTYSR